MIYNSKYTVIVLSILNGEEYAESPPASFTINTPPCFQVNTPDICSKIIIIINKLMFNLHYST